MKKKQGFSLVELMISLIVISIITAAFAPVVTKKLKASGAAYIASGGNASTICTAIQSNGDCKLCTKNKSDGLCLLCEAVCTKGQYLDYDRCACNSCTDSNCELCSEKECLKCQSGYELRKGSCVPTCSDKDLMYIDGLCVTKYNMGDKKKFQIPDTVKLVPINGGTLDIWGDDRIKVPVCWYGLTSDTDQCNSSTGPYSGCGRVVCNWAGAREVCAKFRMNGTAWRLPTTEEVKKLSNYTTGLGTEGLQLCTWSTSSSGITKCSNISSGYNCKYASGSWVTCSPGNLWTSEQLNFKQAYRGEVSYTGAIYISGADKLLPHSVRCVQGGTPDTSDLCTITDPNCEKCTNDGLKCAKCRSSFVLTNGQCGCPVGEYEKNGTCESCSEFNDAPAVCTACNANGCTGCTNGGISYNGSVNWCVPCAWNQFSKNNYCHSCNDAFGINATSGGGYCWECTSSGCTNCGESSDPAIIVSNGMCMSCSSFATNGGKCTACNSGGCTACTDGYLNYSAYGGKATCIGEPTISCATGQYVKDGACSPCSDFDDGNECNTCDSNGCISCGIGTNDGYVNSSGYCRGCSDFDGNGTWCLQCTNGGCINCSNHGVANMFGKCKMDG